MSMLITNAGQSAVAQALADGTPITVTEVAFGTEDRHPTGGETALTTEVVRKPVLASGVDGQKTYFDARLEAEDGPYVLYEVGLFDDAGTLLFIGRMEGFNKLVLAEQPITLDARIYVLTSQFQNVVVQIDTSFAFVPADRRVDTAEGVTGGGDLSANRTLKLDIGTIASTMTAAEMDKDADRLAIWDADDAGNPVQKAISPRELGNAIGGFPLSLIGPAEVYPGTDNTYTITDYDAWATWSVSADAGTVTRSAETITLSLPVEQADGAMVLQVTRDGRLASFDITILPQAVAKPAMTSPADGATDVASGVSLSTGPFATVPAGVDTHASSDWQVATDAAFASVIWSSTGDASNLESVLVPYGTFSTSTTYYARARHTGSSLGVSDWADPVSFTTADVFVPGNEVQKLLPSDGQADDGFSREAMAVSGSALLIGSYQAQRDGPGAAYVFEDQGGIWTETQKLTASDGAADDSFGYAVAIDGTFAAVGAYLDDDNGNSSGSVYIFENQGGTWTQVQKLIASDGTFVDYFGVAVYLSGNWLVVGASNDDPGGVTDAGAAYIFENQAGTWTEVQKIVASDGAASDKFGIEVALDGTFAFIGAPGADTGAVYVFENQAGTWTEVQKLIPSDGASGDWFGVSMDLEGANLLVGAYSNAGVGAAYLFENLAGTWTEAQKLTPGDGASGDLFGMDVAVAYPTIVVGASAADPDGASTAGAAYIFQDQSGTWSEVAKITASDKAVGDQFGQAVAALADTVFCGSHGDDDNGSASGSAYVFK